MCERIIPAILEGGAGISRTGAATYFSAFSVNLRTVTAPLVVVFSCSVVSDSLVTPWTSLQASSVHGISQVRVLEWVAISSSGESSLPRDWTCVSCISREVLYH